MTMMMLGVVLNVLIGMAILALWIKLNGSGVKQNECDTRELQEIQEEMKRMAETVRENGRDARQDLQAQRLELGQTIAELRKAFLEENQASRRTQHDFEEQFRLNVTADLEKNRQILDDRLKEIQNQSQAKLEDMRKTVDEKLQESMERHFNESFKMISERLEQVHRGLGEMQELAAGVGDLKKVLTNVKTRGNIGEIQLATILEDYLAPDQFVTNVSTVPNSREVVEFAIKMPGKGEQGEVLMPVDSKFPVEDYQRLAEAYEHFPRMSPELRKVQENFAKTVRKCAGDIHDKYIYPPYTTGFGMMFVPSEGIYAEILRMPGLFENVQQNFNVVIVGPSNLVAFLNALQLGFKTLAIERRSHEVWTILGTVKTEFGKFGNAVEATRKSLQAVVNHIETISMRSRVLERSLKDVQVLPAESTQNDEVESPA